MFAAATMQTTPRMSCIQREPAFACAAGRPGEIVADVTVPPWADVVGSDATRWRGAGSLHTCSSYLPGHSARDEPAIRKLGLGRALDDEDPAGRVREPDRQYFLVLRRI